LNTADQNRSLGWIGALEPSQPGVLQRYEHLPPRLEGVRGRYAWRGSELAPTTETVAIRACGVGAG